jgi:8-oxo-dGTP pyrophosphatase MutT (NUDIX family)
MNDFAADLTQHLLQRPHQTNAEWEARPAAVLVPLYHAEDEWHLLFTERTHTVEDHKGQVAFPGGRVDEGDADRVATALRETEEEIGLQREKVRVLGVLDELLTVSLYRVTPVVGVFDWPASFQISTDELSEVFGVPIRWLADPANLEVQYREPPPYLPLRGKIPVYYFRYGGHTIWGVTGRIVVNFLEIAQPLLASG